MMRLNLLRPWNITKWLERRELSFPFFPQTASYSRITIKKQDEALLDKWVFRKSEILGNHLLQDDGVAHENRVLSPLSLQVVLSLLAAASVGDTRRQILKLLDADSLDTLNYFSSQISGAFSGDGHPRMRCSNALWMDESLSLRPSFQRILNSYYKAPLHPLDFHTQATNVRQQMNSWVEDETSGLVRDLIREGSLDDNSVKLVFTNALYFKGSWDEDSPFPNDKGSENQHYVMVPFLAKRKQFDCYLDGWGMLNHPFRKLSEDKRAFNMLFFYPAKDIGPEISMDEYAKYLEDLKALKHFNFGTKIGVDSYGSLDFGSETLMNVGAFMTPKFNISSEVEASKVLRGLGVTLPFSGGKLTKMLSSFDGKELYVFNIFQKTFMETNEQGIEAATSTAAIVMSGHRSDLPDVPKITYKAYYPSLFSTENGPSYMAKIKLVVQVVNPLSGMYSFVE